MNAYIVGSLIRLSATFDIADAPTDPTAITFKIKAPSGTVTTYVHGADAQVVKAGTGSYYVDWSASVAGEYAWRFQGTGTCQAAAEQSFTVRPSRF